MIDYYLEIGYCFLVIAKVMSCGYCDVMSLKAFAKITWTFDVLGKFPKDHINSGYTNVEMVSFLIDLYDEVCVKILSSKNKKIIINCDNPQIPQTKNGDEHKNICFKATRLMRQRVDGFPDNDIEINIQKNIPLAGGLGGSSTDGVAVIKELNRKLNLKLSQKDIIDIATCIGSDTVFFASDYKVALAKGRGEVVEKLDSSLEKIWLVLVQPDIGILSRDAYAGLEAINYKGCAQKINNQTRANFLKELLAQKADVTTLASCLHNDMEKSSATLAKYPVLSDIKNSLKQNGCLGALMSGSGSTVFGVCQTQEEAQSIAEKMREIYSGTGVYIGSNSCR